MKFSGLYRDVYLVEAAPLHVTFPWEDFYAGVFVTTPTVDPINMNATIAVRTTVRNEDVQPKQCGLLTRIIDRDGVVVLRLRSEIDPKGFVLDFRGLPKGRYSLKTYHHAPSSNTNSMDPNRERLKTLNIHQIPVADTVAVRTTESQTSTDITRGKQLPNSGPGAAIG